MYVGMGLSVDAVALTKQADTGHPSSPDRQADTAAAIASEQASRLCRRL